MDLKITASMKNLSIFSVIGLLLSACSSLHKTGPSKNYTMKPYKKKGVVYKPISVTRSTEMVGLASWYGRDFQGLKTSSGEKYNMYAYTIAHKTWPMGTVVKIENLKNHKTVIARVNDRGPFVQGRVVDCSYAVACKIGLDKEGVAPVKLTVIESKSRKLSL